MSMPGDRSSVARRRTGSFVCFLAWLGFVACGGSAAVDGPGGNHAGASSGAGAGGAAAEACVAKQESGPCDAFVPSFWHNPETGLCEPFVYGGCGGNANRYPSRDACVQACPAVAGDWGACVDDNNCTLTGSGCCGACNPENEQLLAINSAHLSQYRNAQCGGEGTACAPCLPPGELEQSSKYFKPVCQGGRCTLLDIRESALTECQIDGDCTLREGAACCAECDGSGWVPVNKSADLCGGAPTACDACAAPRPFDLHAVCTSGRCELEQTP